MNSRKLQRLTWGQRRYLTFLVKLQALSSFYNFRLGAESRDGLTSINSNIMLLKRKASLIENRSLALAPKELRLFASLESVKAVLHVTAHY